MALVLTGLVEGIRPVTGEYSEGPKKGEKWHFLSLEVKDTHYGEKYSCQLPEDDPQYKAYVTTSGDTRELSEEGSLKGHKIKVTVKRVVAGERIARQRIFKANGEKNIGYEEYAVPIARCQITNVRDMGVPKDEDE